MVVTDRFESVSCRFLRRTIGSRGGPTKGDTVSREVVAQFWEAMASNDFGFAARWLHPDFEHFMPQTREYLKPRLSGEGQVAFRRPVHRLGRTVGRL